MVVSKNLKIIFTISILLNVAFIGVFIGGSFKMRHHFSNQIENLSPEAQHLIKRTMQENRNERRQNFRAMRNAHDDVQDAIQAQEFDEDLFLEKMENMARLRDSGFEKRVKSAAEILKQLDYEDRKNLSGRLLMGPEREGKPPPHHKKK